MFTCELCGKDIDVMNENIKQAKVTSVDIKHQTQYELGTIYFHNDCFYSIHYTYVSRYLMTSKKYNDLNG